MSEQNNQPNYVVCNCQYCDGHIEFNANELDEENSVIPCPHQVMMAHNMIHRLFHWVLVKII